LCLIPQSTPSRDCATQEFNVLRIAQFVYPQAYLALNIGHR
jgi:hypothetical protein